MKTEYQQQIIAKLKQKREELGYSQAEIAKKLAISAGQLGNIEGYNRNHKYTISQILSLCELYNYPIEELMCIGKGSCPNVTPTEIVRMIVEYQKSK